MVRADISDKIQHDWVKIYHFGCLKEPVRGLCCEEYIQGYGAEHFFYAKATIRFFREIDIETCEEDMNTRVRHWGLYFDSRETTSMAQAPKPYSSVDEILDIYEKEGNNNTCSPYYKYYYMDIGKMVGIFDTKKKAKQVGERLLYQRSLWVEQRLKAINKRPYKGIGSDDRDLPFG